MIKKMQNFNQFMTVEQFDTMYKKCVGTHMRKVEIVPIMRELAQKYSTIGEHTKALQYINRSDELALKLLPTD